MQNYIFCGGGPTHAESVWQGAETTLLMRLMPTGRWCERERKINCEEKPTTLDCSVKESKVNSNDQ